MLYPLSYGCFLAATVARANYPIIRHGPRIRQLAPVTWCFLCLGAQENQA
ncbi:hypothetical protein HMPREF9336_04283 [Segniliparus rugosus ATCC BAA-974]|uniref:Uncharacterized protein n=1 Tax=Segniliparus rugosus (strain ATCC BAA-974 / DSM 45345 / CCUG 50838 / CIP 108380 / JCM 13579 / CDC 945) TaxID=679197 RepID=U1N4K0_SEGRC|nr:hypothetical protein HMPREF9336_04283 [Segniliparus rugosus ATCC BAA-974]